MELFIQQVFSWLAVIALVMWAGVVHWRKAGYIKPENRTGLYMIRGYDFTRFPRGKSQAKACKWIQNMVEEQGQVRPSLALCAELLEAYYEKYPKETPTIAQLRERIGNQA